MISKRFLLKKLESHHSKSSIFLFPIQKSEMEKAESWERKSVMSELSEGIELSNELKKQLEKDSRDEACVFLVEKIVSCYDNALSLVNCMDFVENEDAITCSPTTTSNVSDLSGVVNKKRKNLPRWSEEVRDKIQVDDGFNWRKYGQKYILGATHPRSYYRCTHRYTHGCLATKQVQRSEGDTCVVKVEHRGEHTCVGIKRNVNAEYSLKVVEPQQVQVLDSEAPTTELYFSMPSSNYNIRIDPNLPEMVSNEQDSDFLIDQIDFDADDYFSLVQGSPENKIM